MTNPDIEAAQIPDNASFPREIVENGITWKLLGAKYGTPQDIRMTMETYVQPVDDHPTPAQAQGESALLDLCNALTLANGIICVWAKGAPLENISDWGKLWAKANKSLPTLQAALSHAPEVVSSEQLAQKFHETYERLAPAFSYTTRIESAKPWDNVPENNKKLMIAVCAEILQSVQLSAPEVVTVEEVGKIMASKRGEWWRENYFRDLAKDMEEHGLTIIKRTE